MIFIYQLADVHCMCVCVCVWALLQEPAAGSRRGCKRTCLSFAFLLLFSASFSTFASSVHPSVRLAAQPKLTPPPYALPTATPRCQPGHASVMTMPDVAVAVVAAVAVAISHCRWRPFDVAFKCQNWLTANLRRRRNDPLTPYSPSPLIPSTSSLNQHTTFPLSHLPSHCPPPQKKNNI